MSIAVYIYIYLFIYLCIYLLYIYILHIDSKYFKYSAFVQWVLIFQLNMCHDQVAWALRWAMVPGPSIVRSPSIGI